MNELFSASFKLCCLQRGGDRERGGSVVGLVAGSWGLSGRFKQAIYRFVSNRIGRIRFHLMADKIFNSRFFFSIFFFFNCSFVFQNVTSVLLRTLLRARMAQPWSVSNDWLFDLGARGWPLGRNRVFLHVRFDSRGEGVGSGVEAIDVWGDHCAILLVGHRALWYLNYWHSACELYASISMRGRGWLW